jgi:hypothetical protein
MHCPLGTEHVNKRAHHDDGCSTRYSNPASLECEPTFLSLRLLVRRFGEIIAFCSEYGRNQ